MFFSGDSSTRKRVDLGGRSSKERDRQKLLEQTRLERNRRLFQRQQNSSALKIQKCFRGRRAVEAEHRKLRDQFFLTYGERCQHVDRHCFGPHSEFLRQLLFFFNAKNSSDVYALLETCRLLQRFVRRKGKTASFAAQMEMPGSRTHENAKKRKHLQNIMKQFIPQIELDMARKWIRQAIIEESEFESFSGKMKNPVKSNYQRTYIFTLILLFLLCLFYILSCWKSKFPLKELKGHFVLIG